MTAHARRNIFPVLLDLFHVSIWQRANRKRIGKGKPIQKKNQKLSVKDNQRGTSAIFYTCHSLAAIYRSIHLNPGQNQWRFN